jgi:hypothetical protein
MDGGRPIIQAIILLFVFCLLGLSVFAAATFAAPGQVAAPEPISPGTPCPVLGCTQPDGACHAAAAPPVPDGSFTMTCPKVQGCSDTNCHGWEKIGSRSSMPQDMSMNLWIVTPVVIVLGLVLLVRRSSVQ